MIHPIQLNPPIPLRLIADHGWAGPVGTGLAIGWFQESIEHALTFIVVMDDTGQVWEVEQQHVRARTNITWGRNNPEPYVPVAGGTGHAWGRSPSEPKHYEQKKGEDNGDG